MRQRISFPDEDVDLDEFVPALSAAVSDYLDFGVAAIMGYVGQAPPDGTGHALALERTRKRFRAAVSTWLNAQGL